MEARPSFTPNRRWKIGLNVVVSALLLVVILIMANYLGARHSRRLHWSSDPRFQLSPVTKEVLGSLTNQVKVIVFFDHTKPLFDMVSDLLKQYQLECANLRCEYVDYERAPARGVAVQAEYKLSAADGDRVIFDAGGRRKVVYARDLSEFDYNAVLKGQEVRRTGFKGEQLFTSALFSLSDASPVHVYFLQGHQEHDPVDADDQIGYVRFTRLLQDAQLTIVRLLSDWLLTKDIPSDCQLLVIANPITSFNSEELRRIDKYLSSGGRLFVLFSRDSVKETTGLERLLATWGVEVGHDVVSEAPKGKNLDQDVVVTHFGNHPVVNSLGRSRMFLILPRSIGPRTKSPQSADAPKVTELAMTSPEGVSILANGRADRWHSSIPMIVAVEKGAIQGIAADRGAARIVVAGDSYFLANTGIQVDANRDFARNAVNWLLSRDVLVQGIGTRSVKEYRLTLTTRELSRVRWAFLAGFPGGVLFLGFVVWMRRRK